MSNDAFIAVAKALSRVDPTWQRYGKTAQEAAVNYINQLPQAQAPVGYILMSGRTYTFRLHSAFAGFGTLPNGHHDVYLGKKP